VLKYADDVAVVFVKQRVLSLRQDYVFMIMVRGRIGLGLSVVSVWACSQRGEKAGDFF